MNQDINGVFRKIREVCIKEKALQQERLHRGECYNLFNILGLSSYELKHSAIIANLLDPHGSHGCGDAFLRAFFEVLSIIYPFNGDNQVTSQTEVYAGAVTDGTGGRIDILVSGTSYGLIIENKIYAADQNKQLVRYDAYAKERFSKYDIVYLTLYGSEASEASVTTQGEQSVDYLPMSYADKGLVWLGQCTRLAYDKPLVRESINQYIQTIKQLTCKDMNQESIKQIIEIGVNNPEVVAILSSHQNDIAQGIREKYIFKPLYEYAKRKDWHMEILEKDCSEPLIRFSRDGWRGAICISSDCDGKKSNKGWWINLWIGIELKGEGVDRLKCLKESNSDYPYGYEYLKVTNWYATENFPAMQSEAVDEIIKKIEQITQELEL